jgi:hypothetical protein
MRSTPREITHADVEEVAIEAIVIGCRRREKLGRIDALARSI